MPLETAAPAPAETLVSRPPDVVLEIVSWVDDAPKPTAMTSRGYGTKLPEAKYQRTAKVRNPANGKEAIVPVVGTMRQFQFASNAFVEGYKGSEPDATTGRVPLYVQPHLDRAAVDSGALL
jgi:hypothetical protein